MSSKLDIRYIAGYLDGEGCIFADGARTIRVQIGTCYRPTLLAIAKACGGRVVLSPRRTRTGKKVWVWYVHGQEALDLLARLLPRLREKKAQARVALKWRMVAITRGWPRLGKAEIARREVISRKLRDLKA